MKDCLKIIKTLENELVYITKTITDPSLRKKLTKREVKDWKLWVDTLKKQPIYEIAFICLLILKNLNKFKLCAYGYQKTNAIKFRQYLLVLKFYSKLLLELSKYLREIRKKEKLDKLSMREYLILKASKHPKFIQTFPVYASRLKDIKVKMLELKEIKEFKKAGEFVRKKGEYIKKKTKLPEIKTIIKPKAPVTVKAMLKPTTEVEKPYKKDRFLLYFSLLVIVLLLLGRKNVHAERKRISNI